MCTISALSGDIGRQGHMSEPNNRIIKRGTRERKIEENFATLTFLGNIGMKLAHRGSFTIIRRPKRDALSLFEEGKVREAHALFERLPDDPVSSAYRARIERMMTGGVSESPVWDVKEK
jgi:hypothetical protein